MEMVAASKMRKAQQAALATRSYAEKAVEVLESLGNTGVSDVRNPLFEQRSGKRTLVLLITSDRGLCGGLNSNLVRKVVEEVKALPKEDISIVSVGKKGRDMMMSMGYSVVADFSGTVEKTASVSVILPIAQTVLKSFENGEVDRVLIAYTKFVSTLTQKPTVEPILPLTKELLEKTVEEITHTEEVKGADKALFLFEPSPEAVLASLLPRLIEMEFFQALLESGASEHSARMMAMKNATDAAGEIINDLTFSYNQARQASITAEIAEIAAGAEAV